MMVSNLQAEMLDDDVVNMRSRLLERPAGSAEDGGFRVDEGNRCKKGAEWLKRKVLRNRPLIQTTSSIQDRSSTREADALLPQCTALLFPADPTWRLPAASSKGLCPGPHPVPARCFRSSAGSVCWCCSCSATAATRDPASTSPAPSYTKNNERLDDRPPAADRLLDVAASSCCLGDNLYDATLTDGDCRLRVTLDPGLNRLVERGVLRSGAELRHVRFSPAMLARGSDGGRDASPPSSYRLVGAEVKGHARSHVGRERDLDSLPWFGNSEAAGPLLPLRANRTVFLPLWNNVDFSGAAWSEPPPDDEEEEEEEEEDQDQALRPTVSVADLRSSFLRGGGGVARRPGGHLLIVRIINKSHLMYYGRSDRNCECPYQAVLEVCDQTGSVRVVLWNTACVRWYRRLKPGDIIALRRYRVKHLFLAEEDDIEISVNSRNPSARVSVLPPSSVCPQHLPPVPAYSFSSSKELLDRPHGGLCDVIGLLTFAGRSERIRSTDGRGAELLEYRWLRLEDGSGDRPITVKLFSTSQPETHGKLHPLSVVVCTRLRLVRAAEGTGYLTNTTYTQVYCTGLGHHSQMMYRRLQPVRHFLRWLKGQDEGQVLSRARIGGFFPYPPLATSLEAFMRDRRGQTGFLQGAELQRELDSLCCGERSTFCIQATVTMVTYSRRGQEDSCLFWMDGSLTPPRSSCPSTPLSPRPSPSSCPSTPRSPHPSPSSPPSSSSLSSTVSPQRLQPPPHLAARKSLKRKSLLQTETPNKRCPRVTLRPQHNKTVILFDASMEFLQNTDEEDDEDERSVPCARPPPNFSHVALETLRMRYNHEWREEQAKATSIGGRVNHDFTFESDHYYTLRLRALSDGVLVDATFLPHSSALSSSPRLHHHSNSWTSILAHGAFSSNTPPPSPGDLIGMAAQLANRRLVCVLDACHLGGATTEVVLSRAFLLTD